MNASHANNNNNNNNISLVGSCSTAVALFFFGGRLLCFDKKPGDIRTVAIGLTLRRLASSWGFETIGFYLVARSCLEQRLTKRQFLSGRINFYHATLC